MRQLPLQRRVIDDVVVVERLLDHHQVEGVEPGQVGGVAEAVGGVGVHHQRDVAEARADGRRRLDVPARLHLDLDAPVAVGQFGADALDQLRRGCPGCRSTRPAAIAVRVPPSSADSGTPACRAARSHAAISSAALAIWWPRTRAHRREHLARVRELDAKHQRREELRDDVPRRLDRLRAVVRVVVGDALAPGRHALAVEPDQQERPVVDAAEAGLEEPDERQAEHAKLEAFDAHAAILHYRRFIACVARSTPCAGLASHRLSRAVARLPRPRGGRYTRGTVDYRYLAIEGPVGVGKTALAERLAVRVDATAILEDGENPFLGGLLPGQARRGVPDAAVLPAEPPPPAGGAAPDGAVQPGHDLRLPVRPRPHLRVPQPRRQRAVHLPAALRTAGARDPAAGPGGLPAGADRPAAQAAARARPRPRAGRRPASTRPT